jgi:P-type conjugative transfer protein TrbJ
MNRKTLAALLAVSLIVATPQTGNATWPVFDASNYAQNILQAARALEQINNQIQSLQNQAVMLQNMAKHLQRLDYSSLGQIANTLGRIDGLMTQATGLSFELTRLEDQWREQYPETYEAVVTASSIAAAARQRWQGAMSAFRHTMRVQSQIVENVRADGQVLTELVTRSQGAIGALQASQATNQLLALSTKQQMQIQTLLAAHYRAQAEDAARKTQVEEAAREMTRRFLGSGKAYSGN